MDAVVKDQFLGIADTLKDNLRSLKITNAERHGINSNFKDFLDMFEYPNDNTSAEAHYEFDQVYNLILQKFPKHKLLIRGHFNTFRRALFRLGRKNQRLLNKNNNANVTLDFRAFIGLIVTPQNIRLVY